MLRRTLLEWDSLPHGNDPNNLRTIPEPVAARLAAVAAASNLAGRGETGVLEHGRHALRARNVVGVIAAEGCTLEILPKIDVNDEGDAGTAAIRRRLVDMLAVALDLRIDVGAITELAWQRETMLDILIRVFAEQLAEAVRQGMPRHYVRQEDDLRVLRGSLDTVRQCTRHAVNPTRLACRFDDLSADIALNRIMKAAVTRLSGVARSHANRRRLQDLMFAYADIAAVPVNALRWDQVVLDRTNSRWETLLTLAKLLLSDRFQTTTGGPGAGLSLLFDMNALFEDYVGRLVRRALVGTGMTVALQGGGLFCLTDEKTERGLFQTRPDILIRKGGRVVHIIDTKWKRIAADVSDPKRGVSQADVYQMMAYGRLYGTPHLTLLFPHHAGLPEPSGLEVVHRIGTDPAWLRAATLDVSNGTGILDRLRGLASWEVKEGTIPTPTPRRPRPGAAWSA